MTKPMVLLSGFADEAANRKTALEQLSAFAALGLRYYSIRFIDLGNGIKNVMKLEQAEIEQLLALNREFDLQIATLGSPLGKVKLVDQDDGTKNSFIPFSEYLERDVQRAIELAQQLGTRLIRGFSFYPPKNADPAPYFAQGIDQIGQIAQRCGQAGLVYGLEIEANLLGSTGTAMAEIHRQINHPALVTIFDGANLSCQNIPTAECIADYQRMKPGLGWMHVKDYRIDPGLTWQGHVDEERLKNFVPVGVGDSGYEEIFRDFAQELPAVTAKMEALRAPGVFLDLEPHLKGGGQFGGFSGPDGMGVALRALCSMLDRVGIGYELRSFEQLGPIPGLR